MASAPKKSRVGNDSELKPIRAGGSRAISPRSNVSEAWNETNVNVTVDGQTADGKRTTTKLDVERNPSAENQQKSKLYGWLLSELYPRDVLRCVWIRCISVHRGLAHHTYIGQAAD
jgi:hypothetical protein